MKLYFKTIDEQIDILEQRGLEIENREKTKSTLLHYNYYKIINATSRFFQVSGSNKPKYRKGTNFQDLVDIHNFDKDLKRILLPKMLEIERLARSIISYNFMKKYPYENAYMNPKYYSNENMSLVYANIDSIEDTMKKYKKEANFNRTMDYYLDKYSSVPFWFVINFVSFGKLVNIYETLDYKLREDIADEFQLFLEENLGRKIDGYLTPSHLLSFLNNAKDIRNISAHDNLIIDHEFENIPHLDAIFSKYNIDENSMRTKLFDTIISLKSLLPKCEYDELNSDLNSRISRLRDEVDTQAYKMAINLIGLDKYIK